MFQFVVKWFHDIVLVSGSDRVKYSENKDRTASMLTCGEWFRVHTSAGRRGQGLLKALSQEWKVSDLSWDLKNEFRGRAR